MRTSETPTGLGIECITNADEFGVLGPAWTALARASEGAHVFLSYSWLAAWLHHRPQGAPMLFVGRRGPRLTAALPLCAHDFGWGPARVRTLRVAMDSADFCDALSDPEHPDDLKAVWEHLLRRRDWHLIDLRYIRPGSNLDFLMRDGPTRLPSIRRQQDTAPHLDLRQDWRNLISRSQRSDWLRRRRRLEEQGTLALEVARTPAELDEYLDQFARMHIARWRGKGETSTYGRSSFRAFLREACEGLLKSGHLHPYRLTLDGDAVAIGLYFLFGRHLLPYAYTFSAAYARYCPVHLLIMAVVDDMRARDLADVHDFGRGDEEYKLRWTDQALPLDRVLVARRSLRGQAALGWAAHLKPALWRRRRLHTTLREWRARILHEK